MSTAKDFKLSCPMPITDYPTVTLAHGGGGKLMHQLIEKMILPAFNSPLLETRHDGAVFQLGNARLAFTTDSYVVNPLFFPGGDIGSLAVNGTVNDLSMCGARPLYLSCGLILEEGLPMETLWAVVQSLKQAAEIAGVQLVTGDTKVVDRGKGDGVFINTAGVGIIEHGLTIAPSSVKDGDVVLLSGDIGRHGIAIMATREGLEFESKIESDCAPLNTAVQALISGNIGVHCLRDLTRGGLGTSLIEIAESSGLQITIDEMKIPVRDDVAGACEVLGFDPLYLANEGRMVVFVPENEAARALELLRADKHTAGAVEIGRVSGEQGGLVKMKSRIGTTRIIDMLSGEQLPRIC
ncbi:MAG: hydrogenase expression/formation protein HypE [Acidobacteria bacterium]|nr:MAG: hydrogenase expression/formation protein HypE [Acidobacteriota bacterium]